MALMAKKKGGEKGKGKMGLPNLYAVRKRNFLEVTHTAHSSTIPTDTHSSAYDASQQHS